MSRLLPRGLKQSPRYERGKKVKTLPELPIEGAFFYFI
nr:MAG TPA: hypothetical protein [Caudoviricetes sp.]